MKRFMMDAEPGALLFHCLFCGHTLRIEVPPEHPIPVLVAWGEMIRYENEHQYCEPYANKGRVDVVAWQELD